MGSPLPRPAALNARLDTPVEEWQYLDEGTLLKTNSRASSMSLVCECLSPPVSGDIEN
jgi:hypothetical protein